MTELPSPRTDAPAVADEPAPAAKGAGRRSLGLMLLLTGLGAVLVLTAVGRVWGQGRAGQQLAVTVTGSAVSGLPGGLALVAMAAAVAVFAVRGAGRIAVGVLALLSGLGVAVSAVLGARDTAGLDAEAAHKLALVSAHAEQVSHTAWPWVALAGGLLLALAGLLTLRDGRDWPSMGARYDAPTRKAKAGRPSAGTAGTPAELWQALDRGEDPTS
ncbi:TIGR02234 family membrane protein [Kitasatospora kazusensis]|uniref:TIGR02234 family membrane protein n=1 Tax=Kitasatospora kazusensis TaxID=407974 RepID=A0ABN2ZV82_9ACTN